MRSLRAQTSRATERQHDLARLAGHELPRRLPRLVAAARLRTWFTEDLALQSSTEIPDWLVEALQDIEYQTGRKPTSTPENRDVAESWLQHLRLQMRIERLVDMPLCHDDIVQRGDTVEDLLLVSSITDDGAIWFRGGDEVIPNPTRILDGFVEGVLLGGDDPDSFSQPVDEFADALESEFQDDNEVRQAADQLRDARREWIDNNAPPDKPEVDRTAFQAAAPDAPASNEKRSVFDDLVTDQSSAPRQRQVEA